MSDKQQEPQRVEVRKDHNPPRLSISSCTMRLNTHSPKKPGNRHIINSANANDIYCLPKTLLVFFAR